MSKLAYLALIFITPCPSISALTLNLSDVAPYALRNNPELAAARLQIAEAQALKRHAGLLSNPELGFEFRREPHRSQRSTAMSFDQKFPITARLRIEKQIAAADVRAAESEVRDAERKLVAQAESLALKLLAAQSQLALREEQMALAKKLADFAANRAEKGELSPLDASQAAVEGQQAHVEMGHWQTERASLTGELKLALGLTPGEPLKLTGELPPLAAKKTNNGIDAHPALGGAQIRAEQAASDVALAKTKRWEDVTVGIIAEREKELDEPAGLENQNFLGLRFSIPLPLWNRNEGEIAAKQVALQRAQAEAAALRLSLEHEAANARKEMEGHAEFARETREKLLPLVKAQADKLEQAYQQGQTDLLTVLRVRDQLLKLQASALDSLRDYHLARVRHEAATNARASLLSKP